MLDKDIFIHKVPKGIRYISDWKDFEIFNFPHILDKSVPGCGFTEYCLTNNENVVLCSPRKILLENKYDQHSDDVFLVTVGNTTGIDIDLEKVEDRVVAGNTSIFSLKKELELEKLREKESKDMEDFSWYHIETHLRSYLNDKIISRKPFKILVTYDSFRRLKEVLDRLLHNFPMLNTKYRVVVDEFQSIFTDSRFKSSTELEFVNVLQGIEKVCYVSATPMMKPYLSRLDEFKNLPFYELDWKSEDLERLKIPIVKVKPLNSITKLAKILIERYITGEYYNEFREDPNTGEVKEFISKELIIYVNSVSNIISIIKSCKLTSDKVNILCANTKENEKTINKLNRKSSKLGSGFRIGKVPLRNDPRKTITLCTRTVYLGADFYSDNARSIVISDSNVECMAVDITLDLPQILGRQRLSENPWKNEIELYVKCIMPGNIQLREEFDTMRKTKLMATNKLMMSYQDTRDEAKGELADQLEFIAKTLHFKKNYISVNNHAGRCKIVVENKLVQIAEERAFDIQQVEYSSRFSVFSAIKDSLRLDSINDIHTSGESVEVFLNKYKNCETGSDRLKVVCTFNFYSKEDQQEAFLNYVPLSYRNYYYGLGPDKCKDLKYDISRIKLELQAVCYREKLTSCVLNAFVLGEKYTKSSIKSKLSEIYESISYDRKAKASDLGEWFEIAPCKLKNPDSGKWEHGFEIKGLK